MRHDGANTPMQIAEKSSRAIVHRIIDEAAICYAS